MKGNYDCKDRSLLIIKKKKEQNKSEVKFPRLKCLKSHKFGGLWLEIKRDASKSLLFQKKKKKKDQLKGILCVLQWDSLCYILCFIEIL